MSPQRIQLCRTKGWRKPASAVSVARPTVFGNPFPVLIYGRAQAVVLYDRWLAGERLSIDPNTIWNHGFPSLEARRLAIMSALHSLRGKDLLCFCDFSGPCHADVLLRIANHVEAARA